MRTNERIEKVQMDRLFSLLEKASTSKFWGEITIRFNAGAPVLVTKMEQLKLTVELNSEAMSRINRQDLHDQRIKGHGAGNSKP